MATDTIWLSTSLFCNKAQWGTLFFDAIEPFITVEKKNQLKDYTIKVNYLGGENLQFSLLTDKKSAPLLAKKTNDYFTQYFAISISSGPTIKLPVDGMFLPFKNCIRYGLYPPQLPIDNEENNYSLSIVFSQIFLDALKNEEVDDETILTFAFYLQVGLIYSISLKHPQFREGLKSTFKKNPLNEDLDITMIRSKFEDNKVGLLEIVNDINNSNINLPNWVVTWLQLCDIEVSQTDNDKSPQSIYNNIIMSVYNHLGINYTMSNMLSYFIEHTLFYSTN
ncbi:MAG: hypothetical protein ABI308_07615 [Mucilaginibacter sp.]